MADRIPSPIETSTFLSRSPLVLVSLPLDHPAPHRDPVEQQRDERHDHDCHGEHQRVLERARRRQFRRVERPIRRATARAAASFVRELDAAADIGEGIAACRQIQRLAR